jgi:pyridinium-3,5-biscarboxylic acid mononucleotide synthase
MLRGVGPVDESAARQRIVDLGDFAALDADRAGRTGIPEVVFAQGKTAEQTFAALAALRARSAHRRALATRCPDAVLEAAAGRFPGEPVHIDAAGRTLALGTLPAPAGLVAVLTGGTSDLPVAREALATLAFLGIGTRLYADVGVAGIGRLLSRLAEIRQATCVIAIAGMEGALASVVTGLVEAPVVGVPTSVGYGVSAGGLTAAAAMLASCAPGIAVVNIDNGFGAAVCAAKILRAGRGA